MSSSTAVVKRRESDVALMPPPPIKRTKRPATVLDEDDYTEALSDIIARDYFPGLAEVRAQDEYLNALESQNSAWIAEAGRKLRILASRGNGEKQQRRSERSSNYNTPRSGDQRTPGADTPRGMRGDQTPSARVKEPESNDNEQTAKTAVDTATLSLTGFQARYTSEDNESFNQVLDKQNNARRKKYAHLWTNDQLIPSSRLIEHRTQQARLLKQREEEQSTAISDGRELIAITSGAISSRPAQPDAWRQKGPDNTFMFNASSVDEDGLQTIMEVKELKSKAGPKQVVYANTRFPALQQDEPGPVPASPSLNTSVIARRDANRADSESFSAADTPRVNGYAFVDEDEPDTAPPTADEPTYRDLLAGQVGDATPNPFTIHENTRREDIHYRLVEKEKAKRRAKERETMKPRNTSGMTPVAGNMTPAARKLMEKLGKTPVAGQKSRLDRMSSREMWTPGNTPRRR